ncbi:glycosyltransferase family 4 protein [Algoriphagus sp.]|uniref:glycosyltransferase family 4 protein n=1 Tax=Algoriphagus sp. TaxID=1872435 RepID=UPI003F6E4B5A
MNILVIHNKYTQRGGEDLVFESEVELLRQKGHRVEVLVFSNDQIDSGWAKLTSALGAVYNIKSYRRVVGIITEFFPDVIHVHNFFHIASPSIFYAASRYQVPVVMTLHNFRLICPSATLQYQGQVYEKSIHQIFPFDAIRKGVYRNSRVQTALVTCTTGIHKLLGTWKTKVAAYIVLTEFAKNKIMHSSLKLSEKQLITKPNFVQDYGADFSEREDHFLFVGRLSEEKGIIRLLEAAANQPEITFRVIGDGPLRSEVERFVTTHGNLVYLGFRDKDFILAEMKRAKALLFPSQWYEGFPMTILEAFSCATPVIASDLGGPGEIIIHGENGLLVDYKKTEALLAAINQLLIYPDLHQRLGRKARETYEDFYTPEKNYELLEGLYSDTIISYWAAR